MSQGPRAHGRLRVGEEVRPRTGGVEGRSRTRSWTTYRLRWFSFPGTRRVGPSLKGRPPSDGGSGSSGEDDMEPAS